MKAKLFDLFASEMRNKEEQEMSLEEYLELCKVDKLAYATPAERILSAIGEPEKIDTSTDSKLSRIFQNRTISRYKSFADFYGMEETVERVVGFFRHAAQGLEEKKQILYLLGPVGSAKSSLAERLKELMEYNPIYVLKAGDELSPVNESPLGLFSQQKFKKTVEEEYNIPSRYLNTIPSPWALKRLKEFNHDISQFTVVKIWPSKLNQLAISKTEPGDDNNQDISSLVGKVDIRKLEDYSQHDPDAYSFSGGLCLSNQGILDFVEMFKAPIKVLHPLLTATQEGNFNGTEEGLGSIPFQGVVLAHSNESEWLTFRNNKNNQAFLDRIYIVKVPYCLRRDEEVKIYKKMINDSSLSKAPCAPKTLELLADFSILTRLKEHKNSNQVSKMCVYNGEILKDRDPKAKTIQEYRDTAGVDEGMEGISTRFAFKILSQTYNFDTDEISADPVHLMYVLEKAIRHEQFPEDQENRYLEIIKNYMTESYKDFIGHEIQKAYLESYKDYGQNLFDRYLDYADHWIQDLDYKDPDTGQMFDRSVLNAELEKIEKPAGISNPKDFRAEVVNFVLRAKANNAGKNPAWTSYEKLSEVIEKKMFSNTEELLPVIAFGTKTSKKDQEKHGEFVKRMIGRGYSQRQCRRLVEWFTRIQKSS
jgi:serine protein kinase